MKNGKPIRIDPELSDIIEKMASEARVSRRMASRMIAKEFKRSKQSTRRLIDDIGF